MADQTQIRNLEVTAELCRENVIRMMKSSGHGHIGGTFSCIDIVTALYFYAMNVDPHNPKKEDRDRFLLSAGHKSMAQYAVLAEKGFFQKEILDTYGKLHSKIPGHPDMHKLSGIEANTGALGHGLSIACGMALGLRQFKRDSRVFVIMGDGELPEGSNWEAAAMAAHYHLDRLIVFVDYNGLQISGRVKDVMDMSPIADRFKAFGWAAYDIDGNSMKEIVEALDKVPLKPGKPTVFISHTIKAKGLSVGEGNAAYHYWTPGKEELSAVEKEIKDRIEILQKTAMKGGIDTERRLI